AAAGTAADGVERTPAASRPSSHGGGSLPARNASIIAEPPPQTRRPLASTGAITTPSGARNRRGWARRTAACITVAQIGRAISDPVRPIDRPLSAPTHTP